MITVHQPETNGQVERANKNQEDIVHSYVNSSHNE